MFCIECGQELPATAKFCSNCGAKIISAKTPAQQPILDDIASKAVDIVVMDETPSFNDGGYTDDDVRKKAAFFGDCGTNALQSTTSKKSNSTTITSSNSRSAETKKYYGKYDYVSEFSEDFAAVRVGNPKTGKWGFIDRDGREVIPLKYDYADSFSKDLAVALIGSLGTGKWGFIDKTGKEVIPLKYGYVSPFSEDLSRALMGDRETGKWGFIDRDGKEVIPFIYDDVERFTNGLAKVKLDGKWGVINKMGKEIIPIRYDDIKWTERFITVKLDNKFGILNHNGNCILSTEYDEIKNIRCIYSSTHIEESRYYSVKKGDKYGIVEYDKEKNVYVKKVGCCLDSIGDFDTTAQIINAYIEAVNSSNVRMAKIRYHNVVYYIDSKLHIYEKVSLPFISQIPLVNKLFYDYAPSDMTWWKLK